MVGLTTAARGWAGGKFVLQGTVRLLEKHKGKAKKELLRNTKLKINMLCSADRGIGDRSNTLLQH
jgi:hypothetical protein